MRRWSLCLLILPLVGCATTSGNDWLNSPIEAQPRVVEPVEVAEATPAPRPRLSHTITLGESYVDSRGAVQPAAPGAPPVQVNVHTQVPVIVNNYGGYGYGYGFTGYGASGYGVTARAGSASARASSGMPTQVGGDFPAIPDYGPRAYK